MFGDREIGHVQNVSLTVLVDNKADLIVQSNETVKYFTDKPLLAEHGFSVLVQINGSEKRILWDAGVSENALAENMRRMAIDFKSISMIALSHGHSDHYAGLTAVLMEMRLTPEAKEWGESVSREEIEDFLVKSQVPIVTHPAALRERWWKNKDGKVVGPELPPPIKQWESLGARMVLSPGPYQLCEGCWTTGYIPRTSFEKSGRPERMFYRDGADLIPDDLEEDQAIVIHIIGKGLVILSGCAHSGIVNTIKYAREFTGIDRVYAVIGGFHLAHSQDEEILETIEFIKKEKPKFVIPSHCTGFRAICKFAHEIPAEFIEGVIGARYQF